MASRVSISRLRTRLSDYIKLAESGEEVVVCRRDVPVAKLMPLAAAPPKRLADVRGWIGEDDPFAESLEDRRKQVFEVSRQRQAFLP